MKKIIDGLLYDTKKAEKIAEHYNGLSSSDFKYISESLYLTDKGNWFIAGIGGAMTKYAVSTGNMTSGSSKIIPVSKEEAANFVERYGDVETYKRFFDVEEA